MDCALSKTTVIGLKKYKQAREILVRLYETTHLLARCVVMARWDGSMPVDRAWKLIFILSDTVSYNLAHLCTDLCM